METINKETQTQNISIKDFVDNYKSLETDADKKAYLNGIISTKYIPIVVKQAYAMQIVEDNNKKDGKLKSSSLGLYLSYVMGIIKMYTQLEINLQDPFGDYDLLQEQGLISLIINIIGDDVKEFQTVLNMCRDDFDRQNYSTPGIVNRITDVMSDTVNEIIGKMDTPEFLELITKFLK